MLRYRTAFFLLAASCLAGQAAAAQFHVPVHLPPRLCSGDGGACREFRLGGGYAGISAPGLHAGGPGGFWEYSLLGSGNLGASFRGYGFSFSGDVDPLSVGHKGGGGMTGGFEADLLLAPRGKGGYFLYGGLTANVSMLDINDPLSFSYSGRLSVEPDGAFSVLLGLPAGAVFPFSLSGKWRAALKADAVFFPGGTTFFYYTGLPPGAYGSSREIDPNYGGGAGASVSFLPWRLDLEMFVRFSSGSGNNEPLTLGGGMLSIGF